MKIFGLQKFTLIDYPGKLACIIFTGNCNFRCPYCHNPCLVLDPESQDEIKHETFFDFLKKRQGKLDGVVISGGEPTLQNGLKEFIEEVKRLNFLVKLDTNGSNPQIVKDLISEELIDYLGIDYKAPSNKYQRVSMNKNVKGKNILNFINHAVKNLGNDNIDIRTTVHKDILSEDDLSQMWNELFINKVKKWTLQQYNPTEVLDEGLSQETWNNRELIAIAHNISPSINVRTN